MARKSSADADQVFSASQQREQTVKDIIEKAPGKTSTKVISRKKRNRDKFSTLSFYRLNF